jgi:carbonic anhydrase
MDPVDELLANAERYRASFDKGDLAAPPARRVAVVTCMDARIDPHRLFGLEEGEAHVIRNAGGLVSNDVMRSLALSQRALGTESILVVHHTDCGVFKVRDEDFRQDLLHETGQDPPWALGAAGGPEEQAQRSLERLRESPFLARVDRLRAFVYDVADGSLHEVT